MISTGYVKEFNCFYVLLFDFTFVFILENVSATGGRQCDWTLVSFYVIVCF